MGGGINECDSLLLYEMCQHLGKLHNSVNKYFLNEQSLI